MSAYLECFGLQDLSHDEIMRIINDSINKGRILPTYSKKRIYVNNEYRNLQIVIPVDIDDENKRLDVCGFDTQSPSKTIWEVAIQSPYFDVDEDCSTIRRIMVCRPDNGHGMLVLNVINSDVLPCFAKGTILTLQVSAFPWDIEYYDSIETFEASFDRMKSETEDLNDKKLIPSLGFLFPQGFMINHGNNISEEYKNVVEDDYSLVYGKVKNINRVRTISDKYDHIHVIIDTMFGELQLCHTVDMVKEEQKDAIKVGSIVKCGCVIYADPAMFEYSQGRVLDNENALMLIKHVVTMGEADRLRGACSDSVEYISSRIKEAITGIDAVVERFEYVYTEGLSCRGYMSVLIEGDETIPYPVGTRCVSLRYEDEDFITSLVFIGQDEEGLITKIDIVPYNAGKVDIDATEFIEVKGEGNNVYFDTYLCPTESYQMIYKKLLIQKVPSRVMSKGMDLFIGKSWLQKEELAKELIEKIEPCLGPEDVEKVINESRK